MRLIFLSLFFLMNATTVFAQTKIMAQVNDDIISERDFEQRLKLLKITGQADPDKKDIRERLLSQLIDEKLKQQEAARTGVSVSEAEVKQATQEALKQNGLDPDSIRRKLAAADLSPSLFEDQVKSDLLYIRSIRKTAGQRAEPTDASVSAKLAELSAQIKEKQYLISEIVLPVSSEEEDAAVYGQAMQLIMKMRDGEDFEKLALQYSKAATAAQGGLVGWVPENTLDKAVAEELELMQPGQLSTPIKTGKSYTLVALRAVRDPEAMKEQDGVQLVQMFIPQEFSPEKRKEVLRNLTLTKGSCPQFAAMSAQLKTTPQVELGTVPVADLPPPIAAVIRKTPLLQPTAPLKIEAGELILMPCAMEKISPLPSKESLKTQLETRALEAAAARRLRELRREAITEIRQ